MLSSDLVLARETLLMSCFANLRDRRRERNWCSPALSVIESRKVNRPSNERQ